MDFVVSAMHKGGPFMWLIGLLAMIGLVVPVVLGLFSMQGKRVPAALWVLVPGAVLLTGVLGTLQGLGMASNAVEAASYSTKSTMAHAGMSIALYTQFAGAVLCAGLLVLAGWAAGLSGLRGGDGAKASALGAGATAALVILGGLGCLGLAMSNPSSFFTILLGLMLLPCGLFLALAALYSGGTGANRARLAENRLAAAVCLVGSVGAAGIGVHTQAQVWVHEAYARGGAETIPTMVAIRLGLEETGEWVLLAALIVAVVAALIALVPVLKDLGNLRAAASLGCVLFGALCWAGLTTSNATTLAYLSANTTEAKLKGLDKMVSNLPVAKGTYPSDFAEIWVFQDEAVNTYEDGALQTPVSLPASMGDPVLLAIAGDTKASVVSKTDWATRPLKLKLLTWAIENPGDLDTDERSAELETRRLGAVPLTWMPDAKQLNPLRKLVALSEHADGLVVHYLGSDEPKQVVSFSGLATKLSAGPAVDSALVLPAEGWSVSDLVRVCSVALQRQMGCLVISPSGEPVQLEMAPVVKAPGRITAGDDPIILGALDRSDIDAVFWKNMQKFQDCYDRALSAQPGASGEIVLKLVIARDGSVSKTVTKRSTMSNPELEDCLNRQLKRFKFSEPKGGGIAIVSYPLRFTSR